MAVEAKKRLARNEYTVSNGVLSPPKNVTPRQKDIYIRLLQMRESGEDVVNPIQQFADDKLLNSLQHDERQRYIIQISSDYLKMKNLLEHDLKAAEKQAAADDN